MSKITIKDLSLKDSNLTERVAELKKAYFKAMPEVCLERPELDNQVFILKTICLIRRGFPFLIRQGHIVCP